MPDTTAPNLTQTGLPDLSNVSLADAMNDPNVSTAFKQALERLRDNPGDPEALSAFSSFIDED